MVYCWFRLINAYRCTVSTRRLGAKAFLEIVRQLWPCCPIEKQIEIIISTCRCNRVFRNALEKVRLCCIGLPTIALDHRNKSAKAGLEGWQLRHIPIHYTFPFEALSPQDPTLFQSSGLFHHRLVHCGAYLPMWFVLRL